MKNNKNNDKTGNTNEKIHLKIMRICVLFIIIAFLIISLIIFITNKKKITTLTQLATDRSRQIMGYIIKTRNNKIIVIDGGTEKDTYNILDYISNYDYTIDYYFLTHAHNDHAGAFTEIIKDERVNIKNIYASLNDYSWYEKNEPNRIASTKKIIDAVEASKAKSNVISPEIGDIKEADNLKIEILGINNPEFGNNSGNDQSMIIKFNTRKTSIIILGDIGENGSKKLIETQKDKLKSDIVQMSHHGQNGASKELYQIINPKICLWPTQDWMWNNDDGNGYNTGRWSTIQTREWMDEIGVKEHYVEKDGNCIIEIP